ncbi:MAG: response regulator [Patescibacteria group bacterium]
MLNKMLKILVVEDEFMLQNLIRTQLEKRGFLGFFARDVEQALKYLRSEKDIDVIWLDHYLLGKENGFNFIMKTKENPEWHHIPIFLVSNSVSDEKIQAYLRLGVDKYFVKTNNTLNEIVNDIEKYLSNKES